MKLMSIMDGLRGPSQSVTIDIQQPCHNMLRGKWGVLDTTELAIETPGCPLNLRHIPHVYHSFFFSGLRFFKVGWLPYVNNRTMSNCYSNFVLMIRKIDKFNCCSRHIPYVYHIYPMFSIRFFFGELFFFQVGWLGFRMTK